MSKTILTPGTIKDKYNDRIFTIVGDVLEALRREEITKEQARQIIGLAISTDMKKIFKAQLKMMQPKGKANLSKIVFLDYTKESLHYD